LVQKVNGGRALTSKGRSLLDKISNEIRKSWSRRNFKKNFDKRS
jgi:ribosomal protein S19E (S16A)